ncbi:MAG TPA: tRNA preQ1(34) S-adenosylmethionine ribosyltransferase-isomerase QueA [Patescibacteria group bacterium]|nr:tRNA preQ1(34) S-adenosylmethionine ribosyltransferase-isomerase QueA [Patescibacteria group bacterium]
MPQLVSDFDYDLSQELIAQSPAQPRENAKLMLFNRSTGAIEHHHVGDLPSYFYPGDIVVINNTKVFHARLHGTILDKRIELFLVRPVENNQWLALGKPGKKILTGSTILIAENFFCRVTEKNSDGTFTVTFPQTPEDVINLANMYGDIPTPPYIKKVPKDSDYQTIYAKYVGSVAAPTAGFHLTKQILTTLKENGVTILEITLHVGLGTFMPIKSDTLESHTMHSEWVEITDEVAHTINKGKQNGQRIVAVGTTTVRTLEGVAALHDGVLKNFRGDINLFITPGFHFQVIDSMLTNFHLPKSTLIVLVSAFACPPEAAPSGANRRTGRELILHAYREAINNHYRFYSFGDAMLIC